MPSVLRAFTAGSSAYTTAASRCFHLETPPMPKSTVEKKLPGSRRSTIAKRRACGRGRTYEGLLAWPLHLSGLWNRAEGLERRTDRDRPGSTRWNGRTRGAVLGLFNGAASVGREKGRVCCVRNPAFAHVRHGGRAWTLGRDFRRFGPAASKNRQGHREKDCTGEQRAALAQQVFYRHGERQRQKAAAQQII